MDLTVKGCGKVDVQVAYTEALQDLRAW